MHPFFVFLEYNAFAYEFLSLICAVHFPYAFAHFAAVSHTVAHCVAGGAL